MWLVLSSSKECSMLPDDILQPRREWFPKWFGPLFLQEHLQILSRRLCQVSSTFLPFSFGPDELIQVWQWTLSRTKHCQMLQGGLKCRSFTFDVKEDLKSNEEPTGPLLWWFLSTHDSFCQERAKKGGRNYNEAVSQLAVVTSIISSRFIRFTKNQ